MEEMLKYDRVVEPQKAQTASKWYTAIRTERKDSIVMAIS